MKTKNSFEESGQNLIFLISQPRAGSTLLQRILGSHSEIHTVAEPWLMLHPLYGTREVGVQAEYGAHLAWQATQDFLNTLPDGQKSYTQAISLMALFLYQEALSTTNKSFFLDKTPRYYFIIPELYQTFPKAKFVILLRNPLAVLSSIFNTWAKHNWFALHKFYPDLVVAPSLIMEAVDFLNDKAIIVHYEALVSRPEDTIKNLCEKLELEFQPCMIEYGLQQKERWHFGDPENIHKHSRPFEASKNKWIGDIRHPQVWRLVNDYFYLLGEQTITKMGYSFEEMSVILKDNHPNRLRLFSTFSLTWLLRTPWRNFKSRLNQFNHNPKGGDKLTQIIKKLATRH